MTILDMFRLDGRVVCVTGASSGLGLAMAIACAQAGADLVLAARRADRLDAVAADIRALGQRVVTVRTDVCDPTDCDNMVATAVAEFGKVDVLINNAGIASAVAATRERPDEFRRVIQTNLEGAYWCAQACGRVMQRGSSIINISSILGITTAGLPQAAYAASKAGLIGLTRDLAHQWGPRKGIRVNAIAPGFFKTEMTAEYHPDYLDAVAPRMLLGRTGDAVELAATVLWLASPAGAYVTGQTIVVDGGVTIT